MAAGAPADDDDDDDDNDDDDDDDNNNDDDDDDDDDVGDEGSEKKRPWSFWMAAPVGSLAPNLRQAPPGRGTTKHTSKRTNE